MFIFLVWKIKCHLCSTQRIKNNVNLVSDFFIYSRLGKEIKNVNLSHVFEMWKNNKWVWKMFWWNIPTKTLIDFFCQVSVKKNLDVIIFAQSFFSSKKGSEKQNNRLLTKTLSQETSQISTLKSLLCFLGPVCIAITDEPGFKKLFNISRCFYSFFRKILF